MNYKATRIKAIDDVVQYETPVELTELGVKRAPQSWMYVEVDDLWP